jgi:hypothetical protein
LAEQRRGVEGGPGSIAARPFDALSVRRPPSAKIAVVEFWVDKQGPTVP